MDSLENRGRRSPVSMIAMSWIGGLAIYSLLAREFGRTSAEAADTVAAFVVAPLTLVMSYSFMTDVTGASLMLLTYAALPRVLRRNL